MSLDVYLECSAPGKPHDIYSANVTHNLGRMAQAAGIYEALWKPEVHAIVLAGDLIGPLRLGLERLRADPEKFSSLNPDNGWGDYEGLCRFVEGYLEACIASPGARVRVWR